jgi:T-complex protein 1 subunit gamma
MRDINVWEPLAVKEQVYKSAIEASCMLLRIDDVVSGIKKKKEEKKQVNPSQQQSMPDENTFGDNRDG